MQRDVIVLLLGVAIAVFFAHLLRKWWGKRKQQRAARAKKSAAERSLDRFENMLRVEQEKPHDEKQHLSAADVFKLAETYHYGRNGRAVDLVKAARYYEAAGTGEAWLGLGKLWKDSRPGSLGNAGGQGHEAHQAYKAYVAFWKAAVEFGMEDGWIEIGELYMYGLHPDVLPEKTTAGRLWAALMRSGSEAGRTIARRKLDDILDMGYGDDPDAIPVPGRTYVTLPREPANGFDQIIGMNGIRVSTARAAPLPVRERRVETADIHEGIDVDAEIAAALNTAGGDAGGVGIQGIQWLADVGVQRVHNDSQNVHDSMVQRVVNKRLVGMDSVSTDAVAAFKAQLSSGQMQGLSKSDKDRALRVIDSLNENIHSRYNLSEQAIFNKVWGRITAPENADRRDDMTLVLAQQMASGVEHGAVVCSTGKIVRMMGSLDGMDTQLTDSRNDSNVLKPEWAIKEEIGSKAARVRELFEERGDGENAEGMRQALQQACADDYVNTGILKTWELSQMVAPYLEAF